MKTKLTIALILGTTLILSCQKPQRLVGVWDSKYLKVTVNSRNNSDSTNTFEVSPSNYQEVVGLKTARALFKSDGSYHEHYIKTDGSIAYSQSGYWFVHGDTVITAVYKPLKSQAVYRYYMQIYGDSAVFTSLMDYDGDGYEDDEFWGVSIRVNQ